MQGVKGQFQMQCMDAEQVQSVLTRALLQVMQALADAIEGEVGGIINDTNKSHVGLHIFDFLGNAVLAEADAQLASAMPGECSQHSC